MYDITHPAGNLPSPDAANTVMVPPCDKPAGRLAPGGIAGDSGSESESRAGVGVAAEALAIMIVITIVTMIRVTDIRIAGPARWGPDVPQ